MTYIVHSPCCRLLPQVSVWRALFTLSSIPPFLPLSFPFGLVSVPASVGGSVLHSLCPLVPACLPLSPSLFCPPPSLPVSTGTTTQLAARAHTPTKPLDVHAHSVRQCPCPCAHHYSAPAATSPPAPQGGLPSPSPTPASSCSSPDPDASREDIS